MELKSEQGIQTRESKEQNIEYNVIYELFGQFKSTIRVQVVDVLSTTIIEPTCIESEES